MVLPDLRHFQGGLILSDPVMALVGEAWVEAVFTNQGWKTRDLSVSLNAVSDWTNGEKTFQSGKEGEQSNERVQSRGTEKRQTRPRQRSSRKKP